MFGFNIEFNFTRITDIDWTRHFQRVLTNNHSAKVLAALLRRACHHFKWTFTGKGDPN